MNSKHLFGGRLVCLLLALCLLAGAFVSCSGQTDEIPDGYQYATCDGEYFRLFVPTQWTVNTESGVSGAYISPVDQTAVSMVEVPFALDGTAGESSSGTTGGSSNETSGETEEVAATLDDFLVAHLAEVGEMTDFTLEKEVNTTMNGKRAKDITYAVTLDGVPYRYRQVLCKVEGRFYLFTYSSTAASFDKWLDIVDGIIENIVFHRVPYVGEDPREIPEVDDVPAGMKLVSTNDVPYRVFAPESWVVVPNSAASQVYVSEEDRSNVSTIAYEPEVDGYSVADYWKATEEQYRDALQNFELVSVTEDEALGQRDATVYEYTYSLGGVNYHARQVICVHGYMIVTMTYTALSENYDAHLEDAKAMQKALIFRKAIVG